jgi:SAM-dependent methyltransferase
MSELADPLRFESPDWGTAQVDPVDLELLAEFAGLSREESARALADYDPTAMAAEWHEAAPGSADEIRRFYSKTQLYLFELLQWNGSLAYTPYLERLELLAELCPPERFPRALDFGSGIGTAALRLAELGYSVTIADVPGTTLSFAQERLRRHGVRFDTLEVDADVPDLGGASWDVLVCYDVLEHVPDAGRVARTLVDHLRDGGGACIVAAFDWEDERWPHHLATERARFGRGRWRLLLDGLGLAIVRDGCYRKCAGAARVGRRLRYGLWRTTGLYVTRYPPR